MSFRRAAQAALLDDALHILQDLGERNILALTQNGRPNKIGMADKTKEAAFEEPGCAQLALVERGRAHCRS